MLFDKYLIVNTEHGPVKGIRKQTMLGMDLISFQAIPYMEPPLGNLKFRDARSPKSWSEPLDATKEGPTFCGYDFAGTKIPGQFDAMHINVFTKDVDPKVLRPVMVFIHGGGFIEGSSRSEMHGPDYLLQKDIVFVSFNYRVGIFGFLSLEDEKLGIPGNAGLKDQTFALKWIKRNIQKFGGDPNNITIFGESAGGASVHYHLISEHSKGLFNRAILMSGTAFNKTWTCHPKTNMAERLAKLLGWDGNNGERGLLEFLENADLMQCVYATRKLLSDEEKYQLNFLFAFAPTIEPYVSENCFIPKDPVLMAQNSWGNDIDIIIGGCSDEGYLIAKYVEQLGMDVDRFLPQFHNALPVELGIFHDDLRLLKYGKIIKNLYYPGSEPSRINFEGFINFLSDIHFWHGIRRSIMSRINSSGKGNTFVYRFDVNLALNLVKVIDPDGNFNRASHGDDIMYLFSTVFTPPAIIQSREFEVIRRMLKIFYNFAKSGNPNAEDQQLWECSNSISNKSKVLNIENDRNSMIELPENNRLDVWDEIYKSENCLIF